MLRSFQIVALVTVLGTPSFAVAQDSVEPTEAQRNYNDRGVQLMLDGEFEQAAANFRSSLSLGESNIAWLNFGRAMFKLERCMESRDAYGRVEAAPPVASPTKSEIATVLEKFRAEWSDACTAKLKLECPEDTGRVRIDSGEAMACPQEEIPVVPGRHEVVVVGSDGPAIVVAVESQQTASVEVPVMSVEAGPTSDEPADVSGEEPPPARSGSATRAVGFTLLGLGAAGLATGVILDRTWVAPAFDEYEASQTGAQWDDRREVVKSRQTTNLVVFGVGAALGLAGAVAIIAAPRDRAVALSVTPVGVALGGHW